MNYLAHLYLSGNINDGLLIGNFIADAVRGSQIQLYSDEIQNGILLHRKIDTFTDGHNTVRQSKIRLMPGYHKYSAVLVDVFYDHFLAAFWKKHSSIDLRVFCDNAYKLLNKNSHLFPLKSKQFLHYMISYDILYQYQFIEGIGKALRGLSYRARFNSNMHFAHHDLLKDYDLYQEEFEIFFKELKNEICLIK